MSDPSTIDDQSDDSKTNVRRRWVLRLLVALGIGIPVAIEARTFLGLIGSYLFGDGDASAVTTPTATERAGVGVGDELLAATTPTETVREAQILVRESGWRFELAVEVTNTAELPYEFRLGAVETRSGETIDGGASTGRIPPGETVDLTGTWPLPTDDRPASVTAIGLTYTDDDVELIERSVRLAGVTLRG